MTCIDCFGLPRGLSSFEVWILLGAASVVACVVAWQWFARRAGVAAMSGVFSRTLCRVFDHKGPHGTAYKLKCTSSTTAKVEWCCPRCGASLTAIRLGYEKPGDVIDGQPSRPAVRLTNDGL